LAATQHRPSGGGVSEHGLGSFAQAVSFDGLELNARTLRLFTWLERRILRHAHWVFTPSNSAMSALCRDMGTATPPSNWHVLGYGAPPRPTQSRQAARASLGWADDTIYLLAIGRVSPVKRMHVLVEACALAQKICKHPTARGGRRKRNLKHANEFFTHKIIGL
jgi:glycosyltransferase involved in cell wall biosynthesis